MGNQAHRSAVYTVVPNTSLTGYGLQTDSGEASPCIFPNADMAQKVADYINPRDLSPVHLMDIIRDFLFDELYPTL